MQAPTPDRVMTDLDHARLTGMLERLPADGLPQEVEDAAYDLIDSAVTVPVHLIDSDVVTMRTRLKLRDEQGEDMIITLVYPSESDAASGRISVLSPLGLALVGHRVGQAIRWQGADRADHRATLAEILYQPEAAQDFGT
ncbi:GreA/GreB family elongation factor [Achromobacter aloeverae]|uniref:Transcription elongation factor n=1 Tax=Achromobacter aloeverae TaxID=1750518 RepID=A0A4Q1HNN3_9BURK|nr:GreA/GreB family elongation factor [Achromobacter aloeverae]RXN91114.1 transcription elongation factor [Achromobacter aloeverae]